MAVHAKFFDGLVFYFFLNEACCSSFGLVHSSACLSEEVITHSIFALTSTQNTCIRSQYLGVRVPVPNTKLSSLPRAPGADVIADTFSIGTAVNCLDMCFH